MYMGVMVSKATCSYILSIILMNLFIIDVKDSKRNPTDNGSQVQTTADL